MDKSKQNTFKSIHSDRPSKDDKLNRSQFAKSLASLSMNCRTPLVIGIQGGWGSGKTTVLDMISENLSENVLPIKFNVWEHQFDEMPIVALLHELLKQTNTRNSKVKKSLITISLALASSFLKKTSGLSMSDVIGIIASYEKERFEIRENATKLKESFQDIIKKVKKNENQRIVFFIDDLDRCGPQEAISFLECLKLYLSLPSCVFFIAYDRITLEKAIDRIAEKMLFETEFYFDKIIQLSLPLPPIEERVMLKYIKSLLPEELDKCTKVILKGLRDSPREIKRFVNVLICNHLQIHNEVDKKNYDPNFLVLILLLQQKESPFYLKLTKNLSLLHTLYEHLSKDEGEEYLREVTNPKIRSLLKDKTVELPEQSEIKKYIHFAIRASDKSQQILNAKIKSIHIREKKSDIEFNCPKCRGYLIVESIGIGLTVPCPLCTKDIIIPEIGEGAKVVNNTIYQN